MHESQPLETCGSANLTESKFQHNCQLHKGQQTLQLFGIIIQHNAKLQLPHAVQSECCSSLAGSWASPKLNQSLSSRLYHLVSLSSSRLHNSTFLTSKLIHLSLNSPPSDCTKSFPKVLMLQLQEEAPGRDTWRGWSRLGLTFNLSWELGSGLFLAWQLESQRLQTLPGSGQKRAAGCL